METSAAIEIMRAMTEQISKIDLEDPTPEELEQIDTCIANAFKLGVKLGQELN